MNRKLFILLLTQLLIMLFGVNALAYSGESDLEDTIRALKVLTGQTSADPLLAGDHIDGDRKISLGEAIYWMQDASGIPFVDLQAQDYEEDFLLSALALDVAVGERQEIVILDTPRVGLDDMAYNLEDLVFTTIRGETVARVEKEDLTSESVKDTYYYIRGLAPGVAVFQISYEGYSGQKPLVAVNVTEADTAGPAIETDIVLTKYDTIYFAEERIDFTFTVTTDPAAQVSAELNGTVYLPTDGSFTVDLVNGYNPIVITAANDAGATTKVVNLRAKKIACSLVNMTRPGAGVFYEGDTLALQFTGLVNPIPKVSRIYNPSEINIAFDTEMPRYSAITGGKAQYALNTVQIELTAAGSHMLTGGHIDVNWFGDALYSERSVGTAPPNTAAPQTDKSFSVLPDIAVTVLDNPDYDPKLFTITVANTEDIWPGDQVVLNLPDLDIQTIAEAHPEDDDSWMPFSLLNSYTVFVTDIPGLETVTSVDVPIDYELENLKEIKFEIPEDTQPGNYRVRGGYVWVMYGPVWWKKVTYYHKGKIPDITIEVKEAVPGQVHGVAPIQSETLKNRLEEALGKGPDYTGELTVVELKTLTGALDLSGAGITDADMELMQYLIGVTAIDLSDNPDITPETLKKATFDWTLEKSLDFSGCTGLTELSARAFYGCAGLKGFVFPNTLTAIGEMCFAGCTGLTAVTLPPDLTNIGDYAFAGSAITQITIPGGVTDLGEGVFRFCENLQTVGLPANLAIIGDDCFAYCRGLSDIILSTSLTSIGANCFTQCESLTELILPDSLTTVGAYAFSLCPELPLINLPAALGTISNAAFNSQYFKVVDGRQSHLTRDDLSLYADTVFLTGDDAGIDPPTAEIAAGQGTVTLTHQIPATEIVVWGSSDTGIAEVENGVVTGVSGGTAYIYVKSTTDSHGGYCRVTVTDSGGATLSALELSGIALNGTFDPLTYVYTADIAGDVRSTVVALQKSDAGSTVQVNDAAVTPGAAATVALDYPESVIEIKVTSADTAVTKTYVITITMSPVTEKEDGRVAIGNPVLKDRLALAAGKEAGKYTENLTVTELADITGAIDLSSADLLDSDMAAMQYLTGVSAIDFSDNTGLTVIPSQDNFDWTTEKSLDFSGCIGVEGFHDGDTSAHSGFQGVANLTGIMLPETMSHISSAVFRDCTKLAHVVLPGALKSTGSRAFYGCSTLSRIDLPEGLETLGDSCFAGTGLKSIVLPSSLISIGNQCFADCEQLIHLTIPASVTEIKYGGFKDSGLALLDLRQTAFTETDTEEWSIPDTTLVVYPGSTSAGMNTSSAELTVGEEGLTLSHTIPDGLTVVWSSTDEDVAVVSADGLVTGVGAGTAIILVSSEDGTYFDYCRVTFTETETPGLTDLFLTGANLDQAFDPQRVYYTAGGDYFTPFRITATTADPSSTITVNGSAVNSGTPSDPVDLSGGETTFTVAVTTDGRTRAYTIVVSLKAVYEADTGVSIVNVAFMHSLAVAAGKGADYSGPLTYDELAAIQFDLDLSGLDLSDADMAVMKYLTNVTALDLSGNTALTAASATGAIFNWTMLGSINFRGCTGITEILDNAFEGYGYLSDMVLPETLSSLGDSSFAGTGFVSITLPGSITTLGREIFKDCIALAQADLSRIPVTALADARNLFGGCTAITDMADIVLPAGITALPVGLFNGCTGITAINLPASITVLGDSVFAGTGITEADLSGMTHLGQGVLRYCVNLRQVVLPGGITRLDGSFAGCSALTTVELPDSLTIIGGWTFRESGITHLVVPAGVTSIGLFCFQDSDALVILDLSATSFTSVPMMWRVPSTTTVLFRAEDAGLSDRELNLTRGENAALTHTLPEGTPVVWLSSNTAVATVSDTGVVTAVGEGTALIAIQSEGETYNGVCTVTVGSE